MYLPQSAILQSLLLFTPSCRHEFTTRKRGEGVRQVQSMIPTTRVPLISRRICSESSQEVPVCSRQLRPTATRSTRNRTTQSPRGPTRPVLVRSSHRRRPLVEIQGFRDFGIRSRTETRYTGILPVFGFVFTPGDEYTPLSARL